MKFDLYGLCVEPESDIAAQKNEFVNIINS